MTDEPVIEMKYQDLLSAILLTVQHMQRSIYYVICFEYQSNKSDTQSHRLFMISLIICGAVPG
jgi:hypothetical protein